MLLAIECSSARDVVRLIIHNFIPFIVRDWNYTKDKNNNYLAYSWRRNNSNFCISSFGNGKRRIGSNFEFVSYCSHTGFYYYGTGYSKGNSEEIISTGLVFR